MPRRIRATAGGLVYHVLNRGVGRMGLFRKAADFAAMEQVLQEAVQRTRTRLLSYCLMSNHWPIPVPDQWLQLVEQPQTEAELKAIRRSVTRGRPFGNERWAQRTAKRFNLESTFRPQGRPRKEAGP